MTDQEIVTSLAGKLEEHDKALSVLYRHNQYRNRAFAHMRSKGVAKEDLAMLWTDIVIQFAKLVRSGKYEHQGRLGGYLLNLCQYMTLNHFRSQKNKHLADISEVQDIGFEDMVVETEELKALIAKMLDKLGGSCKQVLYLWSMSYSMQEIVDRLGLKSTAAARKRKHDCLKRLSNSVQGTREFEELLVNYKS